MTQNGKNCKGKLLNFENTFFLFFFFFFAVPALFAKPLEKERVKDFLLSLSKFQLYFRLIFLVIYEEFFYRVYFPHALQKFAISMFACFDTCVLLDACKRKGKIKAYITIFSEIFSLFIFALAHLYLGLYAVFYAFLAAGLFRFIFCSIKNKVPAFCLICLLHASNNILILFLS